MSFDRTSAYIKSITDDIGVEQILEMMTLVLEDAYEMQQVNSIADLKIDDDTEKKELYAKKFNRIVNALMASYDSVNSDLNDIRESLKLRMVESNKKITEIKEEFSVIVADVTKLESEKAILEETQKQLCEERGHMLSIGEECKKLEEQIRILSDSELDKKAEEKEKLEADLAARKNKFDVIENEKNNLLKEFIKSENDITELQKEKEELESKEKMLLKQKSELEENIAVLQKNVREYEEWVEKYPDMSAELQEKNAEILLAINAVESTMSEDFIKENLFEIPNIGDNLSVVANSQFENVEQLKQWFNDMGNRISGMIGIYEKMLGVLSKHSKQLTEN